MKLTDHAKNIWSQFGEDGVLAEAFRLLNLRPGLVVEFGAGDGLHLSNTAQFWQQGWPALLVEADPELYASLVTNTADWSTVRTEALRVQPTGPDCIDSRITDDVAFMSIDIDDADYQVFAALQIRPTLVLVEFNPTMPLDRVLVGAPGSCLQSSPLALHRLAQSKGYGLIAVMGCNCLFVVEEKLDVFSEYDTQYTDLVSTETLTHVVTDWHGRYVYVGPAVFGINEPHPDARWELDE